MPSGELFQIDLSGLKTRWLDVRTRRILKLSNLEVSKNHPNTNPNHIALWKIALIDDHSRYKRVRYIATPKPTSNDVIVFLLESFREMGVPKILYSDNDGILVGKRMQRAERILNEAFNESGGFKLDQHLPGNSKGTGKVEGTHKIIERFERLIGGLYEAPTLENLNNFCARVCDYLNWKIHRTTGEKPALRFRQTTAVMRVPPPALLDAAFKAKEFPNKPINANVTVSIDGAHYQLPRNADYPFVDLAGTKARVTVVWPPDVEWLGIVTADGTEYTVERKLWKEDAAGEFKTPRESKRQRAVKALTAQEDARRKAHKEAGTRPIVPLYDTEPEVEGRLPILPRQTEEMDASRLAELAPGAMPPSLERTIDYFTAIQLLQEGEHVSSPLNEVDKNWIRNLFSGRREITTSELRAAVEARQSELSNFERQRSA